MVRGEVLTIVFRHCDASFVVFDFAKDHHKTHSMTKGAGSNFPFIEPMMALPFRELPVGDWIYEMKFDGYRALAFNAAQEVRLVSRNQKPLGIPQ